MRRWLMVWTALLLVLSVSAIGTAGAAATGNAKVVATVSFRAAPSTDGTLLRYLKSGEQIYVTSRVNAYWYAVTDGAGKTGYVSSLEKYVKLTGAIPASAPVAPAPAAPAPAASAPAASAPVAASAASVPSAPASDAKTAATNAKGTAVNAQVAATVSFRAAPSTDGALLRYLKAGEPINVTAKVNAYWYAVKLGTGETGYVSAQEKYVNLIGTIPAISMHAPSAPPANPAPSPSAKIEATIAAGLKYLGTPYEYGSSRNTTTTFDCSDFVRQAFKDALNLVLPADSRQQGAYVKEKGGAVTSWQALKRGDLMFFMDYKGTSASLYNSKSSYSTTISHAGIYLGDGQVLHTYSKESGGVRIDSIVGKHWEYRFLFGGSAL